jgi:cation diffusion facilitator CzcD-associated flavoprotein CzcO
VKSTRVAVIGSGVSGLAAIRELVEAGHEVQAYERTDDVIGVWARTYETVTLLTSRDATSFRGYPMPGDYPTFPSGDDYRRYIRSFARDADLLQYIRFKIAVVRANPVDGGTGGWDLIFSDGTTDHVDAVVAAHGHLTVPFIPAVPGQFDGPQLHTSQYRNPGDMSGETVLVVGSGNSACDMVMDAINSGRRAYMSLRTPTWFVPQSFYGRARGDLSFLGQAPGNVAESLNHFFVKVSVGDPADYGFPQPLDEDWTATPPTFSTLIPYWAQRGKVQAKPQIERLDGRVVHFVDGTSLHVDTLIWATGYQAPVPFLPDDVLTTIGGYPARLLGGLVSADADNLYYSGMVSPRGGAPHNYGRGAVTLAQLVTARHQTGGPLAQTLFRDEEPSGRMDWLLADWIQELERIEARLAQVRAVV